MYYQFIMHNDSIWSECSDGWDDRVVSWKAIGTVRRSFPREVSIEKKLKGLLEQFYKETNIDKTASYYVVEYQSGRLDVCFDYNIYNVNDYIIVEADRGEDCGKILGKTCEAKYKSMSTKMKYYGSELERKKIIRLATAEDIECLKERKENELLCLQQCKELVESKNINMDIIGCEYQWDMKKITFYFKSGKRIDFRDLLKELFKLFKIRIWLCAEKKSLNLLIKEIIE
ncbi:hypothetical protein NGRA_3228 [Nosema granulosis]|uniref:PSP1 C-terminal domain-containing protein n=1 Tax=Nosema granulosis TaxID=83296 RepID=A0A9P6GV49_9MICR|nr:hypothetical protein NGRA_3228 [Nosema granulosis]